MIHPHSYAIQKPDELTMMSLILANAKALFAKTYPTADRFDVVTSCRTPTGRLDSMGYSAALIVCWEGGKWETVRRSNVCETVDDALFEVMYWVGEEMDEVLAENPEDRRDDVVNKTSKPTAKTSRKRAGEPLQEKTSKKMRQDVEMTG
jgi:hypothetical protein